MKVKQPAAAVALALATAGTQAQVFDGVIKIGVLNDQSSSTPTSPGRARWWPRAWRWRTAPPRKA